MDGKGRCFDNIFIERLWRSVKYECIFLREFDSVAEVRKALSDYFLKGVVPEWDLKDIYYGMMQFMVIQVIGLILIIAFPQIALWLPTYLYGQ